MQRREFITLLGGAAAGWPLAARAQRPAKMLRVGTVAGTPKSSPQWVAFERRMGELGYQEGKNFSFDFLQAASADEYEVLYRKLAAQTPDVILAIGPEVGLRPRLSCPLNSRSACCQRRTQSGHRFAFASDDAS